MSPEVTPLCLRPFSVSQMPLKWPYAPHFFWGPACTAPASLSNLSVTALLFCIKLFSASGYLAKLLALPDLLSPWLFVKLVPSRGFQLTSPSLTTFLFFLSYLKEKNPHSTSPFHVHIRITWYVNFFFFLPLFSPPLSVSLGGFLGGSDGKEYACNVGDPVLIPGSRRIPWRREWQPTPAWSGLPEESHKQKSLVSCSPWRCTESDTTEWLALSREAGS